MVLLHVFRTSEGVFVGESGVSMVRFWMASAWSLIPVTLVSLEMIPGLVISMMRQVSLRKSSQVCPGSVTVVVSSKLLSHLDMQMLVLELPTSSNLAASILLLSGWEIFFAGMLIG